MGRGSKGRSLLCRTLSLDLGREVLLASRECYQIVFMCLINREAKQTKMSEFEAEKVLSQD